MKVLSASLVILLSTVLGFAQCSVDLGEDIHVCTQFLDQSFPDAGLGDSIVITNGTAPYQYQWSITPIQTFLGSTLYASTFLDDTTSALPTVLELWEDSLTLFLRVEDALEQVCYDTITVSASYFTTHLGQITLYINPGDSVQLWGPNIGSNYPVDSLLWQPTTGLNHPEEVEPWASPETTQYYSTIIWDSQGCSEEGSAWITVVVNPVGIEGGVRNDSRTLVYSNNDQLTIESDRNADFELVDAMGRLVLAKRVNSGVTRLNLNTLSKGTYVYRLHDKQSIISSGKLLLGVAQ